MSNCIVPRLAGLVVLAVFAGCSQSPSESPAPTPSPSPSSGVRLSAPSVVGTVDTWELVKFQGQPVPGEGPQTSWEFSDTVVLMTVGNRSFIRSYEIDSSTEPKRMTITFMEQPKGGRGIFNLTEDTFIIKISEEDDVFAENFETEKGYDLMEFRRKQ